MPTTPRSRNAPQSYGRSTRRSNSTPSLILLDAASQLRPKKPLGFEICLPSSQCAVRSSPALVKTRSVTDSSHRGPRREQIGRWPWFHSLQLAPVSVHMQLVRIEARIIAHDVFVGSVLPGVIV